MIEGINGEHTVSKASSVAAACCSNSLLSTNSSRVEMNGNPELGGEILPVIEQTLSPILGLFFFNVGKNFTEASNGTK